MRLLFYMPWLDFKARVNNAAAQHNCEGRDREGYWMDRAFAGTGIKLKSLTEIRDSKSKSSSLVMIGTMSGSDTEMVYEKLLLSDQFVIEAE
jgi:hypothetical protein